MAIAGSPALADRLPRIGGNGITSEKATLTSLGPLGATIFPEGAQTEYHFFYSASKSGPWVEVPNGNGTIPANLEFANVESGEVVGLEPETTYYILLSLSNINVTGAPPEEEKSFETSPLHAQAFFSQGVSDITGTSVHLSGQIIPDNFETHWHFEYSTSLSGPWTPVPGGGTILQAEADEEYHDVESNLIGLDPGKKYYVRLDAESEPEWPKGSGQKKHKEVISHVVVSFETAGAPAATTFAVHALDGESVRALGAVRPDGYDTHFHFEYVTQGQFAKSQFAEAISTPEVDLGAGSVIEEEEGVGGEFLAFQGNVVGQDLPGLPGGETYHLRLVATNASPGDPIVEGGEQTLVVPNPGPGEEKACPNGDLRIGPSASLPDCRAYEQITPSEKEGAMDLFKYGVQTEGWQVGEDGDHFLLHAPGVQWGASPDSSASDYAFSRATDGWLMVPVTPQPAAGLNSYRPQIYNADLTQLGLESGWNTTGITASPNVEFKVGAPGGPYATLASVPTAQVPPEAVLVAASEDFNKVILQLEDHTLLGSLTGTTSGDDLYEFVAGQLHQLNVTTTGSLISSCGAKIAHGEEGFGGGGTGLQQSSRHAVSTDGSRVFFTDNCNKHLYMRVNGAETVDIGEYRFLAANPEGSELLLERHTGEIYEDVLYDVESKLTKLVVSAHKALGGSASEDLSVIYISSGEQLAPEAPSRVGNQSLYRYDAATGTLHFVMPAVNIDSVSPDGHDLYFESARLEGVPGGSQAAGNQQVYRYDSAEDVVQCVSCASPFDQEPKLNSFFVAPRTNPAQGSDGVPNRTIASSDGDYVFFDTPAALVPQDVDGEVAPETHFTDHTEHPSDSESVSSDVYEWRKNGVDGCVHVQGCLSLISSGRGGYLVELLGTTPSGRDVFFATHESLVLQDVDTAGDVYDARVGGGFPPPSPRPVECEGDACLSPTPAPIDTTPASLTFSGPGNPKPANTTPKKKSTVKKSTARRCKSGTIKKKGKCVKKARVRKAARRAVKRRHGGRK